MISLFYDLFLLNGFALIGLSSLAIPLLIHLLNPSRGKLVLIGNIDFIKKAKNIRIIEIKIRQWLLLLLRLIIFFILVLLLAELVKQEQQEYPQETRVFISPDWLNNATDQELEQIKIDHAKDPVILLAAGFSKLSLSSLEISNKNIPRPASKMSIDSLLAELDDKNLIAEKNILYTTNRMEQYSPEQAGSLSAKNFDWRVKPLNPKTTPSTKLNISIFYSSSRVLDNQHLKLALDTLSKTSNIRLAVNHYPVTKLDNGSDILFSEANSDWIFWLSENPVPSILYQQVEAGSYLLLDISGHANSSEKNHTLPVAIPIVQFWNNVYRQPLQPVAANFKPIWFNQNGQILLSSKNKKQGKIFQFHSRFHPDWTDLVKTVRFPLSLSNLLNNSPTLLKQRQISNLQLATLSSKAVDTISKPLELQQVTNSLRPLLILILCLVWLIERWLSENQYQGKCIFQKRDLAND